MDDDDVRALAELQVDGALADRVRLPGMSMCPHCHRGFGSASLSIHVRRCRALTSSSTNEENGEAEKTVQPTKKRQMRSLVDLCLRFVTKHFESVCMDKIVAFPEAEAALIATMPRNLVHRMVINLVKESKQLKMSNRELSATKETLENALDGARRDVAQLQAARDWASISRAKMVEQQENSKRLYQELEVARTTLSSAEAENQGLRSKIDSVEKKLLQLVSKLNTLNVEKATLKKSMIEAQRREMDATRQLALTKKALTTTVNTRRCSKRAQHPRRLSSSSRGSLASSTHCGRSLRCRERPRADGSKIPYPASLKQV